MQKKWYRQGTALLEEIRNSITGENEMIYWYLGQCGFAFKRKITVYIDPVLNDLTDQEGNTKRHYPAPFDPEQVSADYVLCTHGHSDHLAIRTLAGIAKGDPHTKFIVPGACIAALTDAGIAHTRIIEAHAHEKLELPHLTVFPIPAEHPVREKTPQGADVALCYHLTMDGIRILHLGDTYLSEPLLNDLQSADKPDLFFAPINGSDYFRTARNCIGNLFAAEAAQLAVLLKADVTIPTHYDMMKRNTADPLDFVRAMRELDSAAKWQLPALGEGVVYRLV